MGHQVELPENTPIKIQYGHTDDRVVIMIIPPGFQLGLTVPETNAMIAGLEDMKAKLAEHQKHPKPPQPRAGAN